MKGVKALQEKQEKLVIGLMSGTSLDGIDAALVAIGGCGSNISVRQLGFVTVPFDEVVREELLHITKGDFGGSYTLSQLNFLIGQLSVNACKILCESSGVSPQSIDLVGSHGQTVYHQPEAVHYLGYPVRSTLQIGEAAVIAEAMECLVVSDFRVRDLAAGGLGAPLVPYTEYLLYCDPQRTVGLQNIGGIGNITVIPRGAVFEDVFAFDTGPGNMILDQLATLATNGKYHYDKDGALAARGQVDGQLLGWMMRDPYLRKQPPKTTGRERYGTDYVKALCEEGKIRGLGLVDLLATATRFTAETIKLGVAQFSSHGLDRLIVGGGGSQNPVLMTQIRACLPLCEVMTQEMVGWSSHAKEAIAFAILANEAVHGISNNMPRATGASKPVIMGKISF